MPPKRSREDLDRPTAMSRLSEQDQLILRAIKSKKDKGISISELRAETKIAPNIITKSIKSLLSKKTIKEVRSVHKAGAKMLMAIEFEPSEEISGGVWYADGALNADLISGLRVACLHFIRVSKVATTEMIVNFVNEKKILVDMEFSTQQALEILGLMLLEREIEQCISTGVGEFESVHKSRTCYRLPTGSGGELGRSTLASIPCGVCPRIRDCTPDGIISPKTCVYYDRWMDWIDF